MHVALCTPVSLRLLGPRLDHAGELPEGFSLPFAASLACQLLDRGCRVTVVTSAFDCPTRMAWQGPGLHVVATPRRRPRQYCFDLYRREVRGMRAALVEAQPDIVHAQWTYEFADAALGTRLPCLVTARDAPWLIAWHFRSLYRLYRAVYSSAWVVPRTRHLSCVSPHIERIFGREPGLRADVCVVPNGMDRREFVDAPRTALRNPAAPVFYAITEWNRLKNVPCLLRAFARVRREIPGARLVVNGPRMGPGQPGQRWAARQRLGDGVTFNGLRPHGELLRGLEQDADAVVHTTREESFSKVVLEAMVKGVPVVGGRRSGGVPWLLDGGQAGLLADIEDPSEVAAQMLRLVREPTLYRDLAARAWERARQEFTLDAVADRYLAAYQRVLEAERVSPR